MMRRIGVLTSGGDAPGMNAALRAVVRTATGSGVEVFGVRGGYRGLLKDDLIPLGPRAVGGILIRGGTMLGSGRIVEFCQPEARSRALALLRERRIEGLIVIGGDGSQAGALELHRLGFPVVGIASSIDNDLAGFDTSIGVDTALNTAVLMVDRLRDTAFSHHRAFVVEVMGRHSGFLALMIGLASGAKAILTPEWPVDAAQVEAALRAAYAAGKTHFIAIVAEGSPLKAADLVASLRHADQGYEVRLSILGHVQRGGSPTVFDRVLATRSAATAVEALLGGASGVVAGLVGGKYALLPMEEAIRDVPKVPAELLNLADLLAR